MTAFAREKMAGALEYMKRNVGRTESGGPNIVWVWDEVKPEWQGQPWCAAATTAAYLSVGVDLRKLYKDGNSFYCPAVQNKAESLGAWKTSGANAGDLVLFDWQHDFNEDHIGIAAPAPGDLFFGYEGNTQSGLTGDQSNGDGLYYRGRPRGVIAGWVDMERVIDYMVSRGLVSQDARPKPATTTSAPAPVKASAYPLPSGHFYYTPSKDPRVHSGYWERDRPAIRAIQKTLGIAQDGGYGPATKAAVIRFQKSKGLAADGAVGPTTWVKMGVRV